VKSEGEEDTLTDVPNDPHAAAPDEDPLEHLGEEIPDPWDDDAQTDWVTQTVEVED
jgi:hypothetical protein